MKIHCAVTEFLHAYRRIDRAVLMYTPQGYGCAVMDTSGFRKISLFEDFLVENYARVNLHNCDWILYKHTCLSTQFRL
jgi:hypothetical protein